jgi:hypothetical protein
MASPVAIVLGPNSVDNTTGFEAVTSLTDSGYQLEVSLPWTTLGLPGAPAPNDRFGLDVHVVDNDNQSGSREHKLAWFGWVDESWRDTRLLGEVALDATDSASIWPPSWTGAGEVSDSGFWMHGHRFPGDWIWLSMHAFPWVYHVGEGWSYVVHVPGSHPWAWSFTGPTDGHWSEWN